MKPLLVLFTDESYFPDECELIREMIALGLERLHLRKPESTRSALEKFLGTFSQDERRKIVVHHERSLAKEWGLYGVHVSYREYCDDDWEGENLVSASGHDMAEIEAMNGKFEYLFLSPIFESISKRGYGPKAPLSKCSPLFGHKTPVLALGGVTSLNIREALAHGFGGAGVLGSVWRSEDPVREFRGLKELVEQSHISHISPSAQDFQVECS